jgi:hypothetical protein
MGGYGSGRWGWHTKKTTVDECYELPISEFRKPLEFGHGYSGSLWWSRGETRTATIGFRVEQLRGVLVVRLIYTTTDRVTGEKRDSDYPVVLRRTRPHFGGVRWWWTCPLTVSGAPCRRRAAKLYLPPSGWYFGCRQCYNLTYRSTQEYDKRVAWYRKHPEAMTAALRLRGKAPLSAIKAALDACGRW